MTLQSSGAISISQIKSELGSSSNSLRTLSAAAGKSAPDGVNEFYGYSHANPIPYSLYTRNHGSGLCIQAYRSITASIAMVFIYVPFRLYNDGSSLHWQVKESSSYSAQTTNKWDASGNVSTVSTSWVTLASWTGATAGMVDWSGSASGGGGGTFGTGSIGGDTIQTGATYAAADATWRTLSSGQSMGFTLHVRNTAECYASSTRYYTATFHNIYGRRSGYDDTSIGSFQARGDATATSNNCF